MRTVAFTPTAAFMRIALLLLAALGCKADATQLLVVVRSDLPAEDVRVVRVSVTDLDDTSVMLQRDFDVGPEVTLPFSFGISPPNDKVGHTVEIVAEALPSAGASAVVVRRARVGFIENKSLLLTLFLGEECRDVVCSPDQTCDMGICVDPMIDVDMLPEVRPGEELDGSVDGALVDSGPDAPTDVGVDVVPVDTAVPPSAAPMLRYPWNGFATGSARGAGNLDPLVRFEAVPGATRYEVQATGACPGTAFRACDFAGADETSFLSGPDPLLRANLPTRPAREHVTWRVRACNDAGCGPWSDNRYLLAGVDPTDVNGDDFGDILASAPFALTDQGRLIVWFGRAAGGLSGFDLDVPPPTLQSGGAVSFVGDINGDLLIDVASVTRQAASNEARFFLGADGSDTPPSRDQRRVLPGSHGGRPTVTGCDVDADGFSDVLVGLAADGDGSVLIYPGAETPTYVALPKITPPEPGADQAFGGAVACVGDVDGDGISDFAVGAPRFDGGSAAQGRVYLIYGDSTRTFARHETIEHLLGPSNMLFGQSVAGIGDANGDGYSDFAAGSVDTTGGNVRVFFGGVPFGASSTTITAPGAGADQDFGHSLAAAGDVDGADGPDLLVGAPGSNLSYVFFAPDFMTRVPVDPPIGGASVGSRFGDSVGGRSDVDGDGIDDIVVGCPRCEIPITGVVYRYSGSRVRDEITTVTQPMVAGGLVIDDELGRAVAGASP